MPATLTLCASCRDGLIQGDSCGNCGSPAPLYVGSEMPLVGGGQGKDPENAKDSAVIIIAILAMGWGAVIGVALVRVVGR